MPQITHYDNDGATEISAKDWPNIFAGTTGTPRKFAFKNTDGRAWADVMVELDAVDDNDGIELPRIGLDTATLSPPFGLTATVAASGGTFTAGTYYAVLEAYNATGRTIASDEVAFTVVLNGKVTFDWTEIVGASGYRLYISATSDTYGASSKQGSDITPSSTVTKEVTVETTSTGTPALVNTTGGASGAGDGYGTAPSLSTAILSAGAVAIGKWVFYWVNRIAPPGMANDGNPRLWDIHIFEG